MSHPWPVSTPHDRAVRGAMQAIRALDDAMDRMDGGMKGEMAMNASDLTALRMHSMRGVAERYTDDELAVITRLLSELSETIDPR